MDIKKIEQLLDVFQKSAISGLNVEEDAFKLSLKNTPVMVKPSPQPAVAKKEVASGPPSPKMKEIKSLSVGYFTSRISPQWIQEKRVLKKGATLFTIKAMNIESERHLEQDAVIHEVLVSDGTPVEYGQPLVLVEER